MIRIVLADDSIEMRTALRLFLRLSRDVELVGEAPDGQEAINCVRLLRPDVLVSDIQMPGLDGFSVTKLIRDLGLSTRVILISFDVVGYMNKRARKVGAQGYIQKDHVADHLLPAIKAVHRGETFFVE